MDQPPECSEDDLEGPDLPDQLTALAGCLELARLSMPGNVPPELEEALLAAAQSIERARTGSGFKQRIAAASVVGEDPAPYGTQKILVIDDDPGVCYVARRCLEQKGYQVRTVTDPREGLELFREAPAKWDVVVLDLTLPEVSGPEVCRRLKSIDPNVRLLMTSGYSSGLDYQELLDCRLRQFLPKPFLPRDLAMRVREVLAQE